MILSSDKPRYIPFRSGVRFINQYLKIAEIATQRLGFHQIVRIEARLHAGVPLVVRGVKQQAVAS